VAAVNPAAGRAFGLPAGGVQGLPLSRLLEPEDAARLTGVARELVAGTSPSAAASSLAA
jgi:PAS domain-containing protein